MDLDCAEQKTRARISRKMRRFMIRSVSEVDGGSRN